MPRFALLRHDSPRGLHWDFFLEVNETLRTWALDEMPQEGKPIGCVALGDHRLAYLDYEGPISGERGTVLRWDEGEFQLDESSESRLSLRIGGRWLRGRVVLRHQGLSPENWTFLFTPEVLPEPSPSPDSPSTEPQPSSSSSDCGGCRG